MKKLSVTRYFLFISIIPTLVFFISLGCYFAYWKIENIRNNIIYSGYDLLNQLSHPVFFNHFSNQPDLLKNLLPTLLNQKGLDSITLFNANKEVINFTGLHALNLNDFLYSSKNSQLNSDHKKIFFFENDRNIVISKPVYSTSENISTTDVPVHKNFLAGWIAIEINKNYLLVEQYKAVSIDILILLLSTALLALMYQRFIRKFVRSLEEIKEKILTLGKNYTHAIQIIPYKNYHLDSSNISIDEFQEIDECLKEISTSFIGKAEHYIQTYEQKAIILEENLAKLEVRNIQIDQDRKNALREAQAKSTLVSEMHYEIKAPLNSLVSFVELLAETHLSPIQNEYLVYARVALRQLSESTSELMEAMLFDAGNFLLASYPFDLRECIDEVLLLLSPQAYKNSFEIIPLVYADVPLKLLGDSIRLKQLLLHFAGCLTQCPHTGNLLIQIFNEYEQGVHAGLHVEMALCHVKNGESDFKRLQNFYNESLSNNIDFIEPSPYSVVKKIIFAMGGKVSASYDALNQMLTIHFRFKLERLQYPEQFYFAKELLRNQRVFVFDENPSSKASLLLQCRFFEMIVIEHPVSTSFEHFNTQFSEGKIPEFDFLILGFNQFLYEENYFHSCIKKLKYSFNGSILVAVNNSEAQLLESLIFCGVDYYLVKPVSYKKFYNAFYELIHRSLQKHSSFSSNILNIKALVADDNPSNLKRLMELLESQGLKVIGANSGEEALDFASKTNFDIVYLDIKMPQLNGYEVAQQLRLMNGIYKHIPIIAVSAYISNQEEEGLFAFGINDYLTKPVKLIDIYTNLARWLPKRKKDLSLTQEYVADSMKNTSKCSTYNSHEKISSTQELESLLPSSSSNHEISFSQTKIFDWEEAVKCVNGDKNIAQEIFEIFINTLPEVKNNIISAFQNKDYELLLHHVHKLHGSTGYCGSLRLKEASNDFEKILREKDFSNISTPMKKVLYAIDEILNFGFWKKNNVNIETQINE